VILRRLSVTAVWLTVLWMLLWRSVSVANVLSGILVAGAVLAFTRQPAGGAADNEHAMRVNPFALAYLVVFVLYKLVEANLVLAWEIVTPRNRIHTGIVAVPLRTESEAAMMVVANLITLTPGTVTIDAVTNDHAGAPPVLYVHVLHLHDTERVRADLMHLEELSVRAFGSIAARRQLASGGES
jgi:multicomponent Na+:H+ antiporter subunit E